MYVYINTRSQSWNDLLELNQYVTERSDHVTAVDKQHVTRFEFVENRKRDVLHTFADDLGAKLFKPWHFIGFDTDVATRIGWVNDRISNDGLMGYSRGMS